MAISTYVRARGTLDAEFTRRAVNARLAAIDETRRIVEVAKDYAPKKTRELADSIKFRMVEERVEGWRIEIIATAPHAAAHERGSGLYKETGTREEYFIFPINAKTLVFKWENAPSELQADEFDQFHFRFVTHPGVPGQSYMRRALRENTSRMWTRVVEAFVM